MDSPEKDAGRASSDREILRQLATALGEHENFFTSAERPAALDQTGEMLRIWSGLRKADRLKLLMLARRLATRDQTGSR